MRKYAGFGRYPLGLWRATAGECLPPVTSQAIRKHLRDRGVGAGVAPEFMAKRNSELIGIRDGGPATPSVSRLARCETQPVHGRSAACVLARSRHPATMQVRRRLRGRETCHAGIGGSAREAGRTGARRAKGVSLPAAGVSLRRGDAR
jgi:hypothetical protein